MRLDVDNKTLEWLRQRGGRVTVIPPRPAVG